MTLRRLLLAISLYTRRIVRQGWYPGARTSAAPPGANFGRYPIALVRPEGESKREPGCSGLARLGSRTDQLSPPVDARRYRRSPMFFGRWASVISAITVWRG